MHVFCDLKFNAKLGQKLHKKFKLWQKFLCFIYNLFAYEKICGEMNIMSFAVKVGCNSLQH